MKRLLISGAAVAATAVVLAGCGGSGSSSSGASGADASTSTATVSTQQIGDTGRVLVDSSGRALYTNDQEKGKMVLCTGSCLSFWSPLTVTGTPSGSSVGGKLGVLERTNGARQVTFDGKLLYTFSLDQPGKVGGDGVADAFGGQNFTWHVVHSDGSASSASTSTSGGYQGY